MESLDHQTVKGRRIVGLLIFTDGSKIKGNVGAAVTWWEGVKESGYSTFQLEPHNTVFQSEMYSLYRAVNMAKRSNWAAFYILSDSRSLLDRLRSP